MFLYVGVELDLFERQAVLVFARIALLALLVIAEFAEIHDPAYRRISVRRYLNKIHALLRGNVPRSLRFHNAQHLTIGIETAHLPYTDPVVHTNERTNSQPPFLLLTSSSSLCLNS